MKKIAFMAVALVAGFALTSCDKSAEKVDAKSAAPVSSELKIAYVEMDTIASQYELAKEIKEALQKKGQNIQATLAQKQQALQNAANKLDQDVQANKYTREQAQSVAAGIQKQQNDAQQLAARLQNEYAEEEAKQMQIINDSLQNFIARYNKDKKYSYILIKNGDTMLYADKAGDITNEIVAGLNKAYKK